MGETETMIYGILQFVLSNTEIQDIDFLALFRIEDASMIANYIEQVEKDEFTY
jgi:hypothetical protein